MNFYKNSHTCQKKGTVEIDAREKSNIFFNFPFLPGDINMNENKFIMGNMYVYIFLHSEVLGASRTFNHPGTFYVVYNAKFP